MCVFSFSILQVERKYRSGLFHYVSPSYEYRQVIYKDPNATARSVEAGSLAATRGWRVSKL